MSIKEQKMKVLKMLEEDVITQEQALDLLEMIAHDKKKKNTESELFGKIDSPLEPFDFFEGSSQVFTLTRKIDNLSLASIIIKGKNSKISITSHLGDELIIKGRFKSVRNVNPMFRLEELDGRYSLDYNYHGVRYVGLEVYIPKKLIPVLIVENSNAVIDIDHLEAKELLVTTKNASIDLNECEVDRLIAATKNSHIRLLKTQSDYLEVATTNAKLKIQEVFANESYLKTSNATIDVQDSYLGYSHLITKNAPIWLDFNGIEVENLNRTKIEAITTNANIDCFLQGESEIPYRVNGTTKRGRVIVNVNDLEIIAQDKGYLVAQSREYEKEDNRFVFNFQTTNGNISIRD